ncbi:MAG: transglycosylase domain-containing protein [Deltaproteobacteria bacterium]|nr:transglycosylase domain-containing protein [Deltaproteobacteria bacterium]
MFKKLFLYSFLFLIIAVLSVAGGLYWAVVLEPGDEIRIENIRKILGKESHVFYSDGETRLGVFFDKAHRQYVPYCEISDNFVNALVASEDSRFFEHMGFDIVSIIRAMVKNIEAGRVVQGGSTLTQQTAKNLFRRDSRSFRAKFKELLFALKLEHFYSKEQIFEFYANQFYVSGNGHGLGVAARYYFDKTPSDLTLVESAFIAGSVKQPNYYNPFIKKTKEAADLAYDRAKTRLAYVLTKMRDLGMIDIFTYNQAIASEIAFKQGKVGYSLDYAMDMVKDAVSSKEVLDGLAVHGITNVAVSGVRIITTVEKGIQNKTLAILRGELSRLDVRMRGYKREEVQDELAKLKYKGDRVLASDGFLFGEIEKIEGKGKDIKITVSFGRKIGTGIIDYAGLQKLLNARVKFQKGLWSKRQKSDLKQFLKELNPGDLVWVSVRQLPGEETTALLSLERYPKVQGGALVLQNGAIKALAGGTENRFFNRAIYAKRTMGSAFKPFVFTAALQLGWNSADLLKNSRDIFVYYGKPYFPRPDHNSPYNRVSMSWAGVHSENVGSVWLAYHLCDQLSSAQFREVSEHLGLAPRRVDGVEEPYRIYRARVRDKYGIVVDRALLYGAAYTQAVANLETDFIFDGMIDEYNALKKLQFGRHFDTYKKSLDLQLSEKKSSLKKHEINEIKLRKEILNKSYLILASLSDDLRNYILEVESSSDSNDYDPFTIPVSTLYVDESTGEISFNRTEDVRPGLKMVDQEELRRHLLTFDTRQRYQFWKKVKLGSLLSVAAFDVLNKQVEYEYKKLKEGLPYSFKTLEKISDFRVMVGLHYLVKLAKQFGIKSNLEPVLSFPLGANVVTLLESTRMYEAMVTGKTVQYGATEASAPGGGDGEESTNSLAILDRIESMEGEILYQAQPKSRRLLGKKTRLVVGHILENVVKFGTGRKADREVKLSEEGLEENQGIVDLNLKIPLLGKTGTANRYTNASFFGYLPGVTESGDAFTVDNGYAVGVYAGFDDNRPMRKGNSRITGATGALPSWVKIVNELLQEEDYAGRLDPVDLSFYGLLLKRDNLGQLNAAVDPNQGGKVHEPLELVSELSRYQPSIMTFGQKTEAGRFKPQRDFQPFWRISEEPL